jgi:hypothetical protein
MYEYLSPGTVRRTFTDGNISAINTDADRFMKVEVPAAAGQDGSGVASATALLNGPELGRQEMGNAALLGGQARQVLAVAALPSGQAGTDFVGWSGRNSNAGVLEPPLSVGSATLASARDGGSSLPPPVASSWTGNGQPGSGGSEAAVAADGAGSAGQASKEAAQPAQVGPAEPRDRVSDAARALFSAPQHSEASLTAAPLSLDGFSVQPGEESGNGEFSSTGDLLGAGTLAVALFAVGWNGPSGQAAQRRQQRRWL